MERQSRHGPRTVRVVAAASPRPQRRRPWRRRDPTFVSAQASDAADCHVDVSDCATSHCRNTVEHWLDGQLGADDDVLQGFWEVIVDLKADPEEGVDWDACMEALGGGAWEGEVT